RPPRYPRSFPTRRSSDLSRSCSLVPEPSCASRKVMTGSSPASPLPLNRTNVTPPAFSRETGRPALAPVARLTGVMTGARSKTRPRPFMAMCLAFLVGGLEVTSGAGRPGGGGVNARRRVASGPVREANEGRQRVAVHGREGRLDPRAAVHPLDDPQLGLVVHEPAVLGEVHRDG